MSLLTILKDLLNVHYKGKCETELRTVSFSLIFQWLRIMISAAVGGIRDPLKQELALEFCRNQNKDIGGFN